MTHALNVPQRTYVVVCRGPHCRERGSLPLRQRLVALLTGRGAEPGLPGLIGYACFGECERGPNVAVYPAGTWFGGLDKPSDADRVVAYAAGCGDGPGTQLHPPALERRNHLSNLAEIVRVTEQDTNRPRAGWRWPWAGRGTRESRPR